MQEASSQTTKTGYVWYTQEEEQEILKMKQEFKKLQTQLKLYEIAISKSDEKRERDSIRIVRLLKDIENLKHENVNLDFQYSKLNIVHNEYRKKLIAADHRYVVLKKKYRKRRLERWEERGYQIALGVAFLHIVGLEIFKRL